jgi:hypothetical protein
VHVTQGGKTEGLLRDFAMLAAEWNVSEQPKQVVQAIDPDPFSFAPVP